MVDIGKPLGRPGPASSMSERGAEESRRENRRGTAAKSLTRERACLAVARKAGRRDREERSPRRAKVKAMENLRRYAKDAKRTNIIMALRRCVWESVRAARGENADELLWFVTPRAVVHSQQDVDEELLDDEAELDDNCEAQCFADECDDREDEDYICSDEEFVVVSSVGDPKRTEPGIANGLATNGEVPEGTGSLAGSSVVLGKEYEVNEDGFVYLLGTAVAEWLRSRVIDSSEGEKSLNDQEASLWGLTEARDIEWAGTDRAEFHENREVDMFVEADRILYWDGEQVGGNIPAGLENTSLVPGCFYGANLERRDGKVPVWHPILLYTLERVYREGTEGTQAHAQAVTDEAGVHVQLKSAALHIVLDQIFARCMARPNRPDRADNLMSRPPSTRIKRYFDKSCITFAQSSERECAKSSVLNALKALFPDADDFVMNIALKTRPSQARFLLDLAKWTEDCVRVLNVGFATPYKPRDREKVTARWVAQDAQDVLLVNLIGSGGVNHVVCVDAREGHKLIYDSAERHPVSLCEESLRCCVGDDRYLEYVFVRKVTPKVNAMSLINGVRRVGRRNGRKRKRKHNDSE